MSNFELVKLGLKLSSVETSFGQKCLENITMILSRLFDIDLVFIGVHGKGNKDIIEGLATSSKGMLIDNIEYALKDTPCANVVGKTMCVYHDDVDKLFPKDKILADLGLKGYLGAPIFDITGQGIGIIVLLSKGKMNDSDEMRSLVQLFAARAGAEIDRMNYERELKLINEALREKERELEYAERVARLGRWKWDIATDKVEWSDVLKEVNGFGPDESVPNFQEFNKYYSLESLSKLQRCIQLAMDEDQPYEVELEIRLPDGSTGWTLAKGEVRHRDRNGKALIMAGTAQDITSQKKMICELQSALKSRDVFLGVASHELKTPITTLQLQIHSLSRLLQNKFKELQDDELVGKINSIKRQGARFEQLVKSLLDFTQINSGKLLLQIENDINLSELAQDVAQRFIYECQLVGSDYLISIEEGLITRWDGQRFEQIISNFLTNALKYGAGGPIALSVKRNEDEIQIEVSDKGIGIAPEAQKFIFDRFARAVDEHAYKGLGLGLSIVQEIVSSVGGKVWVESELGHGSCFMARVPFRLA